MKKLMNILMLSCKKASELIDKKSVLKLSMKENMMLHMHTAMCDGCKAYQKQSELLDMFLHQHTHSHTAENIPVIKNEELKEKIISKL
jgi:hypothetical protein